MNLLKKAGARDKLSLDDDVPGLTFMTWSRLLKRESCRSDVGSQDSFQGGSWELPSI